MKAITAERLPFTWVVNRHKVSGVNSSVRWEAFSKFKSRNTFGIEIELNNNDAIFPEFDPEKHCETVANCSGFNDGECCDCGCRFDWIDSLNKPELEQDKVPIEVQHGMDETAGEASVEIRALPMTYNYLLDNKDRFTAYLEYMNSVGYDSNDTVDHQAGMHIHVNTKHFKDKASKLRFLETVFKFSEELANFSRRENFYSRMPSKLSMDYYISNGCTYEDLFKSSHFDYVRDNKEFNTIEIRCFKAYPDFNWVLVCIELLKTFIDYSKSEELTINYLCDWETMKQNVPKKYVHLREYWRV